MLTSYFFGWFLFETKAEKSFACFRFDICFEINLVLPLGFKVINVKVLHSRNLKRKFKYCNIFFYSLTSVIKGFPTSNFSFTISYLCKNRLNHMSLLFHFSSSFGKIYQLHINVLIEEKSMY